MTQKEFPGFFRKQFESWWVSQRGPWPLEPTENLLFEKKISSDLFSNLRGHFSSENLEALATILVGKLSSLSLDSSGASDSVSVSVSVSDSTSSAANTDLKLEFFEAWDRVVEDFHREKYWGLTTQSGAAPKPPPTEKQKQAWELWTYIWALIQATLIMKFVIFYFGIRAAEDQDENLKFWLYVSLAISFSSLFLFAYRKNKKNSSSDSQGELDSRPSPR